MPTSTLVAVILIMAAGTFALRLSFIYLFSEKMPRVLERALRFVPAAALSALVAPALFRPDDGPIDASLGNERLLAGLAAGLIAYYTRSFLFTVLGGMTTFWLLRLVL